MENKFSSFINNIKNMNSVHILDSLKKQKENLNLNCVLEKTVTNVVTKILKGQPSDVATENIRKEIINNIVEPAQKKQVVPLVKYANSVLMSNVPKDLKSLKNFRKNVASTLIADAKKHIEEKNVVDAQIVTEHQHAEHNHTEQEHHKSHRKEGHRGERRHQNNRHNKSHG